VPPRRGFSCILLHSSFASHPIIGCISISYPLCPLSIYHGLPTSDHRAVQ
jgi:hypothetical protein